MIRCNRCQSEDTRNRIESHNTDLYSDERSWELCENCFIDWLQVMSAFIHTRGMYKRETGIGVMLADEP